MHNILKHITIIFILVCLPAVTLGAEKIEPLDTKMERSAGVMTADALIVRPMGVVSCVSGFGLFLISSPFSALGGNIGEAWGAMVVQPAKFTFARPLGDF